MSSFMQNQQTDAMTQDLHQQYFKFQKQQQQLHQQQALRSQSDVKLLIPPAQTHKMIRPQQKLTVKVT